MTSPMPLRPKSTDLWALAAAQLNSDDRGNINFSLDKLKILADLRSLTEQSRVKCIEKRWRYTRKSGETIVFRDLFAKMVKWIDLFKEVGDCAVQYDPVHAALPWAGVRFLLQIAVNDIHNFTFAVEGATSIAEIICRYAILEDLYLRHESPATDELKRALVQFYAAIMVYLSKVKSYFDQNSARRILKSGLLSESDLEDHFGRIRTEQATVDHCIVLVDEQHQINRHDELTRLLNEIDGPLNRMSDSLRNVQDNLEEPYLQHHEQTKKDVLPGTGEWLLSDPVFMTWKKDSVCSLLWLHGILGSGKSKLVSIVIEDAMNDCRSGNSPPPAFFYCSRNPAEPRRSNQEAVLASIVRQLSSLGPRFPLLDPVVAKYQEKEDQAFASGPLDIDESCALIIQLTEQYPIITLIVDALDECDPGKRAQLLKSLEKILRESSGLVKIFLSSRDDQDIVCRLQDYPNLEIASDKNRDDIKKFVEAEVQELVKEKKLLRHSSAKEELIELIIDKVIEGATGMFRWASMQLQHLCSMKVDDDIRERLGRLPPDLETLYSEIYEGLRTGHGEAQHCITKNTLSWLLCAQEALKSSEFLAAVAITPKKSFGQVSKDQILDMCCNFVVYDATLDVFRFAHLSVPEFLEKRPEYSSTAVNSLAAEICLVGLISAGTSPGTRRLLEQQAHVLRKTSFDWYLNIYWATHCQLAGDRETRGTLKNLLRFFLFDELDSVSPYAIWAEQLPGCMDGRDVFWQVENRLRIENLQRKSVDGPLLVACAFNLSEVVSCHIAGQTFRAASENALYIAVKHGSCQVVQKLLAEDFVQITERVIEEAAGNESTDILAMLLEKRGTEIKITEKVAEAAVTNLKSGKEVMELLLEQRGPEIKITETVVTAAAANNHSGKEVMKLLLEQRGPEVKITEAVVTAAAANPYRDKEVMELLLKQRGPEVKITEAVVTAAAKHGNKKIMALLLEQRGPEVKITEAVVTAAAANPHRGKEVMELLLKQRGPEVKITEAVVTAAAANYWDKEIIELLLEQRGPEVKITEAVVTAAAANPRSGKEVIELLLEQRGPEVKITEAVVTAAAANWNSGKEVIELLLEQRGPEVKITEAVVTAAAANPHRGKEVMELLLKQRGPEVKITEAVVTAAAANLYRGKEVMELLLKQRGAEVKITEAMVEAAAANPRRGKEVMELLLEQRGPEVKITEAVVTAAVANLYRGKEVMELLLKQRGPEVKITEAVVTAAAANDHSSKEVIKLLLEQRGPEVKITEAVVTAAAANDHSGKEIIELLLEQRGPEVKITEAVVTAAAANLYRGKEVMELLLKQRGAEVKITEAMVEAAAANPRRGKEVMELFLEQRGPEIKITEAVVTAVAGNEAVMALLREQRGAETEEAVKAMARR
ncbi:hypothetical protein MMC30_006003 [Trapelia coarctata]|nr:hypothetical protein [Trapelia coarctata]